MKAKQVKELQSNLALLHENMSKAQAVVRVIFSAMESDNSPPQWAVRDSIHAADSLLNEAFLNFLDCSIACEGDKK